MGGLRISPQRLSRNDIEPPECGVTCALRRPGAVAHRSCRRRGVHCAGRNITELARQFGADTGQAWSGRGGGPRAGGRRAAALFGPTLPLKATTAMRLATDPLDDVWTHLAQPRWKGCRDLVDGGGADPPWRPGRAEKALGDAAPHLSRASGESARAADVVSRSAWSTPPTGGSGHEGCSSPRVSPSCPLWMVAMCVGGRGGRLLPGPGTPTPGGRSSPAAEPTGRYHPRM